MFGQVASSKPQVPRMRYRCASCAEIHQGFPALAYQLPDVIHALSATERGQRAVISSDLCILDDARHFVRCVLAVRVDGYAENLEYGPWVELSAADFARYAVWFDLGVSPGWRSVSGRLANEFPGYANSTMGLACRVMLPDEEDQRPDVVVTGATHPLHAEQMRGISIVRATELISSLKGIVLIID